MGEYRAENLLKVLEDLEVVWHRGRYNNIKFPSLQDMIHATRNPTHKKTRNTTALWKEVVSYGITNTHPEVRWERATYEALWKE